MPEPAIVAVAMPAALLCPGSAAAPDKAAGLSPHGSPLSLWRLAGRGPTAPAASLALAAAHEVVQLSAPCLLIMPPLGGVPQPARAAASYSVEGGAAAAAALPPVPAARSSRRSAAASRRDSRPRSTLGDRSCRPGSTLTSERRAVSLSHPAESTSASSGTQRCASKLPMSALGTMRAS